LEQINKHFLKLRAIANKYDLMGLIKMGSPDDEYDSETKKLIESIDQNYSEDQITKTIIDIYSKMFGCSFTASEKIKSYAHDLFELL